MLCSAEGQCAVETCARWLRRWWWWCLLYTCEDTLRSRIEGAGDGCVGADNAEVYFCGAPGGVVGDGSGDVRNQDTVREDGADDGAAGGCVE